jgi:hypothetical protein
MSRTGASGFRAKRIVDTACKSRPFVKICDCASLRLHAGEIGRVGGAKRAQNYPTAAIGASGDGRAVADFNGGNLLPHAIIAKIKG